MDKRRVLGGVLLLALWSAHVYGQFGAAPARLQTIKLRDDLFVIHNDFVPGNTTVLVTNEGVILVDDKFEIDFPNLQAELKKITNQPVRYVVNSHYHADHSGGNARLQAMGAQAVSSQKAREKMVDGKQPGQTNITFDDHLRLYLGGKRVELFYFGRAHTDGDIVALFPDHRTIAMGDMFTVGDDVPPLVDYPGGGSHKQWPLTVDRVLQLDFETVVPGHGKVATKQDLRQYRDTLQAIRTRVRDMVMNKQSRAAIEKVLRSEFTFADFHIQASLDGLLAEMQQ